MSLLSRKVQLLPISPENETIIQSRFIEITLPKQFITNFCVDGRKEEGQSGLYTQSLGGSLHQAVLNWILIRSKDEFNDVVNDTFNILSEKGYKIGLHTGSHTDNKRKSDCGFADNLGSIIDTLKKDQDEIFEILVNADPTLADNSDSWREITDYLSQINTGNLPIGYDLVTNNANIHGADVEHVEGNHNELAAYVNTQPNTTLDVNNNQDTQAFNLDLWWVLEQANELGLNKTKAKLLSLGLYVATEKVLVEKQKGIRLPLIVR